MVDLIQPIKILGGIICFNQGMACLNNFLLKSTIFLILIINILLVNNILFYCGEAVPV